MGMFSSAPSWAVERLLPLPGHGPVLRNQVLSAHGGVIERIAPAAGQKVQAGSLAMPAFANAHDHGRGLPTLSCGIPDGPLELWVSRLGVEPRTLSFLNTACAFARMAQSGICAAVHCHNTQNGRTLLQEAQGVAKAAKAVGIRIAFAVPFAGENPFVYESRTPFRDIFDCPDKFPALSAARYRRNLQEGLDITDALAKLESETFHVQYGPVGPQWTDRTTLEAISARSASTGRRVHMHFFETRLQQEWADATFPEGIVNYFDRIGLLSPRLTLAHGVWLRPDEIEMLAARGVLLSCNISSNMRLASGLPPIRTIINRNMKFGIGLDGMSLEDDDDILREARLLRGLMQTAQPGMLGPGDSRISTPLCFDALMRTGRESITGPDNGGLLEEGRPADMVIVNTDRVLPYEIPDAILPELLLTRLTRRDVRTLVVNGNTIVDKGKCQTIPQEDMEKELHDIVRRALTQATASYANTMPWEEHIRRYYTDSLHTSRQ
jgi:5-methylthioadenosine/S-adenosylhomocysteine deaminase